MICQGCGGVLGRDCWNESDCVWITRQMALQNLEEYNQHYEEMAKVKRQQDRQQRDDYWRDVLGFDPVAMGM